MKKILKFSIFVAAVAICMCTLISCGKIFNNDAQPDPNDNITNNPNNGENQAPDDGNQVPDDEITGDETPDNNENNGDVEVAFDDSKLAEGANLRIMSYNVLHPGWGNKAIAGRDEIVANVITHFSPDVVGLQEMSPGWHAALQNLLVDNGDYEFACPKTVSNKTNYTTFLYNTNKVKLVDSYGYDLVTGSNIRVYSVAVFERLEDGKQFVVTNTHPTPNSSYKKHMNKILVRMAETLEKYPDLPVFFTADWNTEETFEYYPKILDTGVEDSKYAADVIIHGCSTIGPMHTVPDLDSEHRAIDHIFVNHNAKTLLYSVVVDYNIQDASDHRPLYADFYI